ncbi:MAG: tetratricopeptide repeat protein [Methanoregulaceae archaeon]|nr:tetratricopeptide repeat protein [Methanoregulaceae archaeon]
MSVVSGAAAGNRNTYKKGRAKILLYAERNQTMTSVLLVDDEPALLEITRTFLERSGEVKVQTSRSALEALGVLKSQTFDVIVADFEMPMMDGLVLLKILRAEGNDTPFIIFTGKGREHVVIEALNNGADFYLQKGGDPKSQFTELVHMIQQAVQRKNVEASLQTSEKIMTDIINFLPDATFAIDRTGKVISWNSAIEEMTGVKASEIVGKGDHEYSIPFYGIRRPTLIDLIFESSDEIKRKYYSLLKKEGNVLIAEIDAARPKGKEVILWAKATPLYDTKGTMIGAIESVRDITEFRRLDRAQRQEKEGKDKGTRQAEFSPGLFDKLFGKSTEAWYKRGVELYYRHGKFSEAIQFFDRILETEPNHVGALNGRGICLKELGRFEEAIQSFDKVIAANPHDEEVYYNKGEALEKIGKASGDLHMYETAIRCFDKVIEMNPYHVYAWNYRGVCLKEMGRYEEAKRCFDHAQLLIRRGDNKMKT